MPYRCLLLFALLLVLAACERPFVDIHSPDIEIIEPDFSTVFLDDEAVLRMRASSFREVDRVEIGGRPAAFDPGTQTWTAPLKFGRGLNVIRLSAFDIEGVERVDTIYALHLPMHLSPTAPSLGASLGGHTATTLATGATLVTGGARSVGGSAEDGAYWLPLGASHFEPMVARLQDARTGHTATLLPDGRVLLLGGSRTDALEAVSETVETAEVFDPVARTFQHLPVVGAPIRRALHTALLRQTPDGPIIDLFGGRGDVQYAPPRLGTRRDLRRFLLRNDTLFALSPAPGPFLVPLAGHTQAALSSLGLGEPGRFLFTGSFFLDGATDNTSFLLDFRNPLGLIPETTEPPRIPRTRHAAAALGRGLVVLLGGRQATPETALATPEVFAASVGLYFKYPVDTDLGLVKRFAHTATISFDGRILLLGGFGPDGTGAPDAEYIFFDF